jgi:hypothetical protein
MMMMMMMTIMMMPPVDRGPGVRGQDGCGLSGRVPPGYRASVPTHRTEPGGSRVPRRALAGTSPRAGQSLHVLQVRGGHRHHHHHHHYLNHCVRSKGCSTGAHRAVGSQVTR